MNQIAPKGFQPLEGTATRLAIMGDSVAPKGQFAGAQTAVRRSWNMPFKGQRQRCAYEVKPGKFCVAYHTKDSEYCVGHRRSVEKQAAKT